MSQLAQSSILKQRFKTTLILLTAVSCVRRTRLIFRYPAAQTYEWPPSAAWLARCAWRIAWRAAWCPSSRALPDCTAPAYSRSPAANAAAVPARLLYWSALSPCSSRPLQPLVACTPATNRKNIRLLIGSANFTKVGLIILDAAAYVKRAVTLRRVCCVILFSRHAQFLS